MKNLKTKIIASIVAATILVPTFSVYAEETGTVSTDKLGTAFVKQQERLQAKQTLQQEKAVMIQKKDTIKENHKTNAALRQEIIQKRTTVKNLIKDIRENKKQLASDTLEKIEKELEAVKNEKTSLEDTKGTIKKAFETVKTDIKAKNFQDAKTQLDSIISIQNTRTEGLKKLSTELDNIINLLNTASSSTEASN